MVVACEQRPWPDVKKIVPVVELSSAHFPLTAEVVTGLDCVLSALIKVIAGRENYTTDVLILFVRVC